MNHVFLEGTRRKKKKGGALRSLGRIMSQAEYNKMPIRPVLPIISNFPLHRSVRSLECVRYGGVRLH